MNTPRVAMQETKKAFRKLAKTGDLQAASQSLCTLKGVGPGMASGEPTWPQNLIRVGARSLTTLTKLCPLLITYLISLIFVNELGKNCIVLKFTVPPTCLPPLVNVVCEWPPRAHQNQTVPICSKQKPNHTKNTFLWCTLPLYTPNYTISYLPGKGCVSEISWYFE